MSEVKTDSVVNVSGDNDSGIDLSTNDVVAIKTADTERMRVTSDGKIGIGVTSPGRQVTINGGSSAATIALQTTNSGNASSDGMLLQKDTDNSVYIWNQESSPMIFATNNTERMRILAGGVILMNKTASDGPATAGFEFEPPGYLSLAVDGAPSLTINRNTNDGGLVLFRQANSTEGTITVSGSTVSYNGGHLARFSQAADGNRISGLVKGTVMTNLDQMAVWSHDEVLWAADDDLPDGVSVGDVRTAAYTEDNEQLNCMAVSSVEGDANVAGVFVNWDDDDENFTADMNVAMTGDMVIRIAQGTTVARGDLLMSAGDGTAKPQGGDIVRGRTIAKVTSTTKSRTYDDGSYLVPCVLMAC